MPDKKEPQSSVVAPTKWDKSEEMAYHVVPPTDEDGNRIETSAGKSADGKSATAQTPKEK